MRRIGAALFLALLALPAWADRAVVSSPKGANVYSASGKKAKKVDLLARNAEVETFGERDGRVRVKFEGGEGWVAKAVLRELPAAKPAPPEKRVDPKPAPAQKSEAPVPAAAAVPAASPAPAPAPATIPLTAIPPVSGASPAPTVGAADGKSSPDGGYLSQALKEEPIAKVETGPGLVAVLGSLFVVLALVAGAVYLVKMLAGRRLVGSARSKGIQLLATRPLGPRQALLLVEVGGLPLLLAQSEGMVNLISEIRDPEAVRRLNDLYGFRDTPFEAELKSRFDLEGGVDTPDRSAPVAAGTEDPLRGMSSAEDRLAALRLRRRPGEDT